MSQPIPPTLEQLQQLLHYETYKAILADVKDPEKRTPALLQAALKALHQSGIDLDPTSVPTEGNSMGQITRLAVELPPILEDDPDFDQYR